MDVPVKGIDVLTVYASIFARLDTVGPAAAHDTLTCAVATVGNVQDWSVPKTWVDVPAMTTQTLCISSSKKRS